MVWELQRTRFEPAVKESVLVELSRVILASLVFTCVTVAVGISILWVPLLRDMIAQGLVVSDLPQETLGFFAVVTSGLSCGAAYGSARWHWKGKPAAVAAGRVWHQAFGDWAPDNGVDPYLTVEMLNGTVWRGFFAAFDQDPEDTQRILALKAPLKRKRPAPEASRSLLRRPHIPGFIDQPASEQFALLPEVQIVSIKVEYFSPDPA